MVLGKLIPWLLYTSRSRLIGASMVYFSGGALPDSIGTMDGYLTVVSGISHFHICVGGHKGPLGDPVSPALARRRRQTARAELYRLLGVAGTPVSWGLRLFNGKGEQQITI
jgi:hypothetical protein